MNGAEHYTRAEELLNLSETGDPKDVDMKILSAMQGVGHALLALTAANAPAADVQTASRQAAAWTRAVR